ncbi:hypothetical protein ABIF70_006561 [Bradyrhizobium japonicum]
MRASSRSTSHVVGDLLDEGQEQRTVQAALVKIVGRDVGGRDHHGAELEQLCEQAAEDHRVRDVGDVEFVEAEQPAFLEDRVRSQRDDVAIGDLAARDALAIIVDALMRFRHELVEMRAALVLDGAVLEEQVHQHGLAAADFAMDVEPARRLVLVAAEQTTEQALLALRLVIREPLVERRIGFGDVGLRSIGLDRAGRDLGLVCLAE